MKILAHNPFEQLVSHFSNLEILSSAKIPNEILASAEGNQNLSFFLGYYQPKNKEDLIAVQKKCSELGILLQVFSQGCNWGYGTKWNSNQPRLLVNLSQLNQILEINSQYGFATIETGVTQKQLAEAITRSKANYFFDVTGSSQYTSVIGNALQRGIAYQSQRVNFISDLEVLLPNGKIIHTGFGRFKDHPLRGFYSYGLGPSLDGLFFQSHLGIVLSATIQLLPIPEETFVISVGVDNKDLFEFTETLRQLKSEGTISGIPHLADIGRMSTTLTPLLSESLTTEKIRQSLNGDWTLTASIKGTKQAAAVNASKAKDKLKKFGRVFVWQKNQPAWKHRLQKMIIDLLATREQKLILNATEKLRGLHFGQPCDDGVRFLLNPANESVRFESGIYLCTPLGPLCGETALDFRDMSAKLESEKGISIGRTLNFLSDKVLEAVITIHFDQSDSVISEKARASLNELLLNLKNKGYYPYRIGPMSEEVFKTQTATDEFLERIELSSHR